MYATLYNDAQINVAEIHRECGHERWVPLLVYRPKGDPDGPPRLIVFENKDVAYRFAKRNITTKMEKEGWLRGSVFLTQEDIEAIKARGWVLDIFQWPRQIIGNKDLLVSFEVHEFAGQVEVRNIHGKTQPDPPRSDDLR